MKDWKILIRRSTLDQNKYLKLMETIRKIKCTCDCHIETEGVTKVHFVPCCNNGYIHINTKDYWGDLEETYPLDDIEYRNYWGINDEE